MGRPDGYDTAVVGGGIFGTMAAVQLARAGHRVTLFEQKDNLLQCASSTNHRRLHHGYHYPRSRETAVSAQRALTAFREEFGAAIVDDYHHYVGLARDGSLTTLRSYLDFCDEVGLPAREEWPGCVRRSTVDWCLRVPESSIDIDVLRDMCWKKLLRLGVDVRLGVRASADNLRRYDQVVFAAYSALNLALLGTKAASRHYRFEVSEKVVATLPPAYSNTSVLILDGPFVNLNPFRTKSEFILGDVRHGNHTSTTGIAPLTPAALHPALDAGLVQSPHTRFNRFVQAFREFFVGIEMAEYQGSMFTVRTVLPDTRGTDARPSLVTRVDERTIAVLGGKLTNCIEAGRDVVRELAAESDSAALSVR